MPAYREPKSKKQKEELVLNERYQNISKEYESIGYKYVLSIQEKEELVFERYKNAFGYIKDKEGNNTDQLDPETYAYDIQHIFRIMHNKHEWIVYRIIEEVKDRNGVIHNCARQAGWHSSPISRTIKNDLGENQQSEIQGHKLVYEIPFDRNFIRHLIDGSRSQVSDLCVGIGSNSPPDIITSNPQKIWNEEEFIEHDFDDLFGASIAGFSRIGYGGVKEYKEAQQERLKAGTKAVDEAQAKHQRQVQQQQRQAQT